MLIGISGTLGAGKTEVARYLCFQGFRVLTYCPDTNANDGLNNKDALTSTDAPKESQSSTKTNDSAISRKDISVFKSFTTIEQLVDYVTMNWQINYVISHIDSTDLIEALEKRPFFLHISIDAPIMLRYQRSKPDMSLEKFIEINDEMLFCACNPLIQINNKANIKIINTSTSIKDLYIKLSELALLDHSRLRPTWDAYFMRLADLAALRSNCMKRRVGCVIVRDKRVVATGYNGTPRNLTNCNEGGCPRCNKGQGNGAALSTCLCLHAEENALLEAGRDRISGSTGANGVLYCNTCPCLTCSIKIVQSGIKEVVYAYSYSMDEHSHKVMSEAGILLRQYCPPAEGVFI